ncbi:MAG: hypothetical protein ACRCX4_11595 [Bacteroidales bacterium]
MKKVYVLLLILFSLYGCKTADFRIIRKEILSLSKKDVIWGSYQLKKQIFKQLPPDIVKSDTIIFLESTIINAPYRCSIYFSNDHTVISYISEYPLIKRIDANEWHKKLMNATRKGDMDAILNRSKRRKLTPGAYYNITMITRNKEGVHFRTYEGGDIFEEDIP